MLDARARALYGPGINRLAGRLARLGVVPGAATWHG